MAAVVSDRRNSLRRRTLLAGRVHIGPVQFGPVDCMVKSVSEDGARIAIEAPALLSQSFLISIGGAPARRARVAWYRDGQAGLSLEARNERRTMRLEGGHRPRSDHGVSSGQEKGLGIASEPARDRLRERIEAVASRRTA